MDTTILTRSIPTSARRIPRLLTGLVLAITLVAIPAFSPDDASARRMSERQASRACSNAGGSMHYDFDGTRRYTMTSSLPSGNSFS